MARLLPPERDIGVLQAPVRSCLALTGMFLLVLLAVGLLERIGIEPGASLTAIVGSAFALFALAALMSHSRRAADFYVADRKISGAFGGLAGAGSFAGLIAIGLAGGAYASRVEFLVAAAGFSVGYIILALLIAPGLRSSGAYTPETFWRRVSAGPGRGLSGRPSPSRCRFCSSSRTSRSPARLSRCFSASRRSTPSMSRLR